MKERKTEEGSNMKVIVKFYVKFLQLRLIECYISMTERAKQKERNRKRQQDIILESKIKEGVYIKSAQCG